MFFEQVVMFLGAALLLALAPGPDSLGVLSLGIAQGRREALGFSLGCAVGCINHTVLAVLGISALIAASPTAFQVLQWLGAAYLIWIGVQLLRAQGTHFDSSVAGKGVAGFIPYFKRGLIANAINPKVALFFLSFLPQFVRVDGWGASVQIAIFGTLFALVAASIFSVIACFSAPIGVFLRGRAWVARWVDYTAGGLFIVLGGITAVGV